MAYNGPQQQPPPPPPHHLPPQGPGFMNGPPGMRPGGPGPFPYPPPPPPGGRGMQLPLRPAVNSHRIVDITPRKILTEEDCRRKLTNYEAYTIRKSAPRDEREKASWLRVELVKEPLSPEVIIKQIEKLSGEKLVDEKLNEEKKRSASKKANPKKNKDIAEKKSLLFPNQQNQINRLLDDLNNTEHDSNFEWSLVELVRQEKTLKPDKKETSSKSPRRETISMTVYVKRSPLKDVSAITISQVLDKMKAERNAQMNRPPPPPPLPPMPQPGPAQIQKVDDGGRRRRNRSKHYHSDSSSYSDYDSDSETGSNYSSEIATTISSKSGRHSKKYRQRRSRSRHREHVKQYNVSSSHRMDSPERTFHRDSTYITGNAKPRYVPDAPQSPIPALDPVMAAAYQAGKADATAYQAGRAEAAAYQAGKADADAVRFGVPDRFPRRLSPSPRAIISYGGTPRYAEERYVDDLRREDYPRREEYPRREGYPRREDYPRREERMQRDAEEYMDRPTRGGERVIIDDYRNPFAPRPYAPSFGSSGW